MKYISTRGQTEPMDFSDVLLMGLAPDGGLMLPEHYPIVASDVLEEWRHLSYTDLALAIMQRFATDTLMEKGVHPYSRAASTGNLSKPAAMLANS